MDVYKFILTFAGMIVIGTWGTIAVLNNYGLLDKFKKKGDKNEKC